MDKRDQSKKDEIILRQLEVIRSMTEHNLSRMGADFWGTPTQEKHVPAIKRDGDKVTITVGSVVHPMLEEHSITMIAAVSGDTVTVRFPKPGDEPTLAVDSKEPVTAYEICNLHGYWKGQE